MKLPCLLTLGLLSVLASIPAHAGRNPNDVYFAMPGLEILRFTKTSHSVTNGDLDVTSKPNKPGDQSVQGS